jgi:hypothetical protein
LLILAFSGIDEAIVLQRKENHMATTERLPKWVSLLLTLLIGAAFTFGGQLFIAMAANGGNAQIKSCTLDNNAAKKNQIKIKLGKGVAASTLDVAKFHLICK